MAKVIQIGNLPNSTDSVMLRQLFEAHGAVRSATIARHYETGRSTGVGFVEMESDESGAAAIAALNHRQHEGRALSVCWRNCPEGPSAVRAQMFGMNMTSSA